MEIDRGWIFDKGRFFLLFFNKKEVIAVWEEGREGG